MMVEKVLIEDLQRVSWPELAIVKIQENFSNQKFYLPVVYYLDYRSINYLTVEERIGAGKFLSRNMSFYMKVPA